MKSFFALVLAGFFWPNLSHAQSALTLNNTTSVESHCRLTIGDLSFGSFNPLDPTTVTSMATLKFTCTAGSYGAKINGGQNGIPYTSAATGSISRCQRTMKNTTANAYVGYDIYYDEINIYNPDTASSRNPQITSSMTCDQVYANSMGITFSSFTGSEREFRLVGVIRNIPGDRETRSSVVDPTRAPAGVYVDRLTVQITY